MGNVPHIKVEVEYDDAKVLHQCAFFIDSISFLCRCEAAIRRGENLPETTDHATRITANENMKKLMGVRS